jgi:hypothetical protein
MSDVFISHVEEDADVALEIARGLNAAGFSTWCYETDSYPGPDYTDQMFQAIEESQAVVVVISADALSSAQVEDEVKWAREQGKRRIPVLKGIKWAEFRSRRPTWARALGTGVAIEVPSAGVSAILPRVTQGLKVLAIEPSPVRTVQPPRRAVAEGRWPGDGEVEPARGAQLGRRSDQGVESQPNVSEGGAFHKQKLAVLEKTVSNPRYSSDLKTLEINDYDLSAIVNPETVLIVVGGWVAAELCDRPVAEGLRDEIDRRGQPCPYRRAIVVTDTEWFRSEYLRIQPVIAVGGPIVNALTKELEDSGEQVSKWTVGRLHGVFKEGPPPRAALWGPYASDNPLCVQRYIERAEGLESFLGLCWASR